MKILFVALAIASLVLALMSRALAADGDAARGQQVFGACAACHSLEPDRSMTGPSLSGLWNRKAGSVASFPRYSPALKSSGVIWDDKTLSDWISDPQHLVPGNQMTFPGIKNSQQRADLVAYLKEATQPDHAPAGSGQRNAQMGGMGMMGSGGVPNLKKLDPQDRVEAISYCRDTYRVTTADGKTRDFWERNLRLKTDSSDDGPESGAPALVPAGMMGDRADVIFSSPAEISARITPKC